MATALERHRHKMFDDVKSNDHARSSGPPTAAERYRAVRQLTEELAAPLAPEDTVVQTMPDVSPTKWHLAHVSWFFETFLLRPFAPGYRQLDERYGFLFNSYYVQAGARHCRARRGVITRPTLAEVMNYRAHVDEHMAHLLETADTRSRSELMRRLEIGLHHEQQHQELLLTDIKHVFSNNPLRPAYLDLPAERGATAPAIRWLSFDGGFVEIGHAGAGFAYDCESPRHRYYIEPFELASRPVTNGEVMAFIEDRGYRRPELWLSEGFATVESTGWTCPFYWEEADSGFRVFTLAGMREVDPEEPASHISYFEADAIARWMGARLPTEQEWEVAASDVPIEGNFVGAGRFHPAPAPDRGTRGLAQLYGDVWEWTRSPFQPYPGYHPEEGALGEYNGKFMCNQFVLRGGSCATSKDHMRPTYRNFFPPAASWQFTGLRLARDT
jgi:ergothioneine biosynthesis protein EgtB